MNRTLRIGKHEPRYPVIQGGMGVRISAGRLAGHVAKCGGIGLVAAAGIGVNSEFFNGRNFFQISNQWIDAGAQQRPNAKRVRIQFNSPEYFALARQDANVLPWLALGQNVQFALGGTVYEIYE